MTKNIIIYLLILIIVLTLILFLFYENFRYDELLKIKENQLASEVKYLENLSLLTENYNELESKYQELKSKDSYIKWEEFEVTSYTSNECGTITYTGFDLDKNYSKYLNVCAVDPEEIKLGSVILVKFENGDIKPYVALDTGLAIKGKRIDLYFTDLNEAINFGRKTLEISVLK